MVYMKYGEVINVREEIINEDNVHIYHINSLITSQDH